MQISNVEYNPPTIQCRTDHPGPVEREIDFNVTVVNTRADTVAVQNVSSHGITVNAHRPDLVGQVVSQFGSIPFTPTDAVLRPKDGQVVYTVRMNTACVAGGTAVPDFIDVDVTLVVRTSVGEFTTLPLRIHQAYQ